MDWSATQYLKFEDERTRPARELLNRVPLETFKTAIDMGCGPGNSTALIMERYPDADVSGIDSDANMLASARERLPDVSFTKADLTNWLPKAPVDLLYANAVFQWLPNHLEILKRLMGNLSPGGVLAIQMPDNLDQPTHRLMEETAFDNRWAERFSRNLVKRDKLPTPDDYYNALSPFSDMVDVWHTIYYHHLPNTDAIVEWVKGTGLRPWLAKLDETDRPAYMDAYHEKIAAAYKPLDDGTVLLPFPRLFVIATKKRSGSL